MVWFERIMPIEESNVKLIEQFLKKNGLKLDDTIEQFVAGYDDKGILIACGGVSRGGIIKCVAVDQSLRGQGITMKLATELIVLANELSYNDLFLYTKPENKEVFEQCGFYLIEELEGQIVLMENSPNRLRNYCKELETLRKDGDKIGSMVLNANPYTLGHDYLVRYAAEHCDWLHIFLVKEDYSYFSFKDRYEIVKQNLKGIKNVTLHEGSDYIISRATFPCYFIKDRKIVDNCFMELDLKIFRKYIAPALGIQYRFVGDEPNCVVTNKYNFSMFQWLEEEEMEQPPIKVVKIDRKDIGGEVISASKVRRHLMKREFDRVKQMVPEPTYQFLVKYAEKKDEQNRRMKELYEKNKK